jgi:hypothetical protein
MIAETIIMYTVLSTHRIFKNMDQKRKEIIKTRLQINVK